VRVVRRGSHTRPGGGTSQPAVTPAAARRHAVGGWQRLLGTRVQRPPASASSSAASGSVTEVMPTSDPRCGPALRAPVSLPSAEEQGGQEATPAPACLPVVHSASVSLRCSCRQPGGAIPGSSFCKQLASCALCTGPLCSLRCRVLQGSTHARGPSTRGGWSSEAYLQYLELSSRLPGNREQRGVVNFKIRAAAFGESSQVACAARAAPLEFG
jgi:hypothetical protein